MRGFLLQVGHVQRAEGAVDNAQRKQKQRRTGQVQNDVMHIGLGFLLTTTVYQQRIRRDQQNLKEYEQVKNIAGQERSLNAQRLKHQQRVEKTAFLIFTGTA